MAVKIIESTDPIDVAHLCVLVYGQPGSRKSSLAQTADEPITYAFDQGIYRAFGRKKAAVFDTWADVVSYDSSKHKTIVVDTVGMALEKLSAAIIAESPKNGNKFGGLSLPGYGMLKTQFANWVSQCRQRGQTLIFTAHEKAEKNGDECYYCPDIVGGSYNTLMNHCDIVGYMHFENGKRVIDFCPTDRWMAKVPPCGWTQKILPDFAAEPHYLAKLIAEAKASMGRISEQSADISKAVDTWTAWLKDVTTLDHINAGLADFNTLPAGPKRKQTWALLEKHAKDHGWRFDAPSKAFVAVEAA